MSLSPCIRIALYSIKAISTLIYFAKVVGQLNFFFLRNKCLGRPCPQNVKGAPTWAGGQNSVPTDIAHNTVSRLCSTHLYQLPHYPSRACENTSGKPHKRFRPEQNNFSKESSKGDRRRLERILPRRALQFFLCSLVMGLEHLIASTVFKQNLPVGTVCLPHYAAVREEKEGSAHLIVTSTVGFTQVAWPLTKCSASCLTAKPWRRSTWEPGARRMANAISHACLPLFPHDLN